MSVRPVCWPERVHSVSPWRMKNSCGSLHGTAVIWLATAPPARPRVSLRHVARAPTPSSNRVRSSVRSIAALYSPRQRSPIAPGPVEQGVLRRHTLRLLASQISSAGCWMARAKENVSAHGSRDAGALNLTFMAFKRAEASSPVWPPDRNAIPGRRRARLAEDSSPWRRRLRPPLSCVGQVNPGSTMLGFRIMPSSITRCM